jgi:hypothetical protein
MSQLLDLKRELWSNAPMTRARRVQLQAMIGALVRLKTGGFIKDGFEKGGPPAQEALFKGLTRLTGVSKSAQLKACQTVGQILTGKPT